MNSVLEPYVTSFELTNDLLTDIQNLFILQPFPTGKPIAFRHGMKVGLDTEYP